MERVWSNGPNSERYYIISYKWFRLDAFLLSSQTLPIPACYIKRYTGRIQSFLQQINHECQQAFSEVSSACNMGPKGLIMEKYAPTTKVESRSGMGSNSLIIVVLMFLICQIITPYNMFHIIKIAQC